MTLTKRIWMKNQENTRGSWIASVLLHDEQVLYCLFLFQRFFHYRWNAYGCAYRNDGREFSCNVGCFQSQSVGRVGNCSGESGNGRVLGAMTNRVESIFFLKMSCEMFMDCWNVKSFIFCVPSRKWAHHEYSDLVVLNFPIIFESSFRVLQLLT